MPYVPIPSFSREKLTGSAEARWQRVREARPDLEPALALQRQLLARVLDAAALLDGGRLPRLSLPPKYVATKLARGVPALAGEPIPLPVAVLTPTLLQLCDALAAGGAGEAAQHIRSAIADGAMDAGSLLTASLHQGAIPFLRQHGGRRHVRIDPDRLVALRPEEFAVPVLERWLAPDTFRAFFRAFLRLLSANGGLPRPAAWFAPFLSSERMRRRIQDQDQLWYRTARTAFRALRGRGPLAEPRPDVLVMGHTHVLDWAPQDGEVPSEKLYVNLGTWTDRAADANSAPDTTLPLLEVWEEDGRLRARLSDLDDDGGEMQRFEALGTFSR